MNPVLTAQHILGQIPFTQKILDYARQQNMNQLNQYQQNQATYGPMINDAKQGFMAPADNQDMNKFNSSLPYVMGAFLANGTPAGVGEKGAVKGAEEVASEGLKFRNALLASKKPVLEGTDALAAAISDLKQIPATDELSRLFPKFRAETPANFPVAGELQGKANDLVPVGGTKHVPDAIQSALKQVKGKGAEAGIADVKKGKK